MTDSIGSLFNTQMPALDQAADIQEAFRIYHYGAESGTGPGQYNPANTSTGSLIANSIAGFLNARIEKSSLTAKGDLISASASSAPSILNVGTNNQILIANSATTSGLQWTSTLTSPTITTPTIDTVNISSSAASASLWNTTLTTGSIATGGALTSGGITLAGGSTFAGTISIANASTSAHTISISNGAGAANKTINIGTSSTGGTTEIQLGSSSGATSTIALNGAITGSSTLTLSGSTLNINGGPPTISSTNTASANIFTTNVSGVNIGSSSIKSTLFPNDGTTSTAASGAGYMGMPQVSVSTNRSFAATDAGKHVYITSTGTTQTIPANGTVAFPIGTTIVVVNGSGVSTSIAITTDTLRLANSSSTGTRTLASNGMCTLVKINSTEWIASGNGLT